MTLARWLASSPRPLAFAAVLPLALATVFVLTPITAWAQDDARELPPDGTLLEPGRYATDIVGPALSFRVAEGWRLGLPVDGPILTLERPDTPGGVVTVTRFDGDAFTDSCDPSSLTLVEPSAARLVEIIAGNPYLEPDAAEPTTAGDFAGLSLDVFTPPYTECRLPFLLLWAVPVKDGEFVQVAGQQSRFIAVDVGPDVLVVAIETPPDVPFAFFAEAATDVLDTLQIEPALTTR